MSLGFGVVVTQHGPATPCSLRRPIVTVQVSGRQRAPSSIQAHDAFGPRSRSGSSAERNSASAPFASTTRSSSPRRTCSASPKPRQTSSEVRQVASRSIRNDGATTSPSVFGRRWRSALIAPAYVLPAPIPPSIRLYRASPATKAAWASDTRTSSVGRLVVAMLALDADQPDLEAPREVARPALFLPGDGLAGDAVPDHLQRLHVAVLGPGQEHVGELRGLGHREPLPQRLQ